MKKNISIYTDGACSGNPGPGGYGLVAIDGTDKEIFRDSNGYRKTTNNRMEILAAAKALELISNTCPVTDQSDRREIDIKITVYSDSQLVVNTMNQGWARRTNKDIWDRLDKAMAKLEETGAEVSFSKVKGHAGDTYNEIADSLAVEAIVKKCDHIDGVYENIARNENAGTKTKNATLIYEEEDDLVWYVEERLLYDVHDKVFSDKTYYLAKQLVKDHYYIPHGPLQRSTELGDEGFRDFLKLVRDGADPYDALDRAEANCAKRHAAMKEPVVTDIRFCGLHTPDRRHIEVSLSNGSTVTILPCCGGFEQTGCTQRESAVTVDIAWKYVGWLNGHGNL